MSFREDLCSNQNIYALLLNVFQYFLPRTLSTGTVMIYTHNSRIGKTLDQRSFHPLCSMPERGDVLVAAFGTDERKALLVATMMAAQFFFAEVNYEAAGAAVTGRRPCA